MKICVESHSTSRTTRSCGRAVPWRFRAPSSSEESGRGPAFAWLRHGRLTHSKMLSRGGHGLEGFTMLEIALCIAIIGFALVAIIGVLPSAMRVQKDNRSDTLIDQDGNYLLEAIRHGSQGIEDLVNYVRSSPTSVREVWSDDAIAPTFYTNYFSDNTAYKSSWRLIGLLSHPRTTNNYRVEAEFRSMSGAAVEKDPNSLVGFDYLLVSEVIPFSAFDGTTACGTTDTNTLPRLASALNTNDLRLTLRWPLSPSGAVGVNKKVFRALVSGELAPEGPVDGHVYYFFHPTTFAFNVIAP